MDIFSSNWTKKVNFGQLLELFYAFLVIFDPLLQFLKQSRSVFVLNIDLVKTLVYVFLDKPN
jgi:hypothetical protein